MKEGGDGCEEFHACLTLGQVLCHKLFLMTRLNRCISLTLVFLIVSMWAILFFLPLPPLLSGLSFSRAVYDDHHQLLRLTLSQDGKYRLYTPLSKIAPELVSASLLEEDQYFYWHPGINPVSLVKAITRTYFRGPRRMGASTITMQVARIRYGIQSKTISGKLKQMLRALQIEMHYSKDEILEAYFNLAPYGNNIEGVGAASLIYFDKSIASITLPEALTLAVIPQNPTKRVPSRGLLTGIRQSLYERWVKLHPEDENKKSLLALPLQMRSLHDIPFRSPHFVNEVLMDAANKQYEVETTLNLRLQTAIEHITRNYLIRRKILGVNNAAVLVVDTRDMGIKAMLGSADFFQQQIGGQINGTSIRRSPGSTLKPFIYALALDQGLIHPATILKDVPHSFGSYNPENFDNDFMGPLAAKDALILSRNIPAIYLAEKLKHPSLYEFLREARVRNLKSEEYYGLALVLGGAEISMQELAGLYAALANDGVWQPLKATQQTVLREHKRLLSAEASFLVLDMLNETPRPDNALLSMFPVAWKTGTSSAYRDAWTVGIVGPYVLAVWLGNFDNQTNPALIGKKMAAPLFFEITNAINTQMSNQKIKFVRPEFVAGRMNLTKVSICKASGMLPTRTCPATEKVWFIPGKSPIQSDTIFREIAINQKTGLRACQFDQHTQFKVYEFWSSDLLKIFKQAGIARRLPPSYDVDCSLGSRSGEGFSPQIISPQTNVDYVASLNATNETIIPLTAVVDADVKNIYWFLNNTSLGKTTRDQSFLWHGKPGRYVIRAVDDYGRSDVRDVTVKLEG
jgi:penicillin-binding protein 1C